MKPRLITVALLCTMFLAAMWGAVARAQTPGSLDTNLEITEFRMDPVSTPHGYPPTQAGGNADVSLFFRFCGPGIAITDVTTGSVAGNFFVSTAPAPHNLPVTSGAFTKVKIRGYRGSLAGVNGMWNAALVTSAGGVVDPLRFELVGPRLQGPAGDDAFASGAHAQMAGLYGCTGDQVTGRLARFKLELPPGFLGNPTALETCPTFLFIASSCSDRSILGASVSETRIESGGPEQTPNPIPTPVYNVATLGLEPARLGTQQLGSEPTGPFAIKIDLRTDGDYGIDSALIDIPKNLGGPQALVMQIDTVLCAQVPCRATNSSDPHTVVPLPPTRPFFRNPTSCKPATAKLDGQLVVAHARKRHRDGQLHPDGLRRRAVRPQRVRDAHGDGPVGSRG